MKYCNFYVLIIFFSLMLTMLYSTKLRNYWGTYFKLTVIFYKL